MKLYIIKLKFILVLDAVSVVFYKRKWMSQSNENKYSVYRQLLEAHIDFLLNYFNINLLNYFNNNSM